MGSYGTVLKKPGANCADSYMGAYQKSNRKRQIVSVHEEYAHE